MHVVDDDQRHSTLLGHLLEVNGWLLELVLNLARRNKTVTLGVSVLHFLSLIILHTSLNGTCLNLLR